MSKNTTYISSDYAFNNPDKISDFEMFGDEVVPVDAYWGFVPEKKFASDNLSKNQAAIRSRFSLGK